MKKKDLSLWIPFRFDDPSDYFLDCMFDLDILCPVPPSQIPNCNYCIFLPGYKSKL